MITYYLRLSHYLTDGSRLTFNYENLIIERDTQYYRKVNSFWLGYYYDLAANLTLSAMVGYANIDNQNYQSDQSVHNYLARVGLSKRFN
jgi:predicted porin